jgi:hypothetical protein
MMKHLRAGYTDEQLSFRKGPESTKNWYASMAAGKWLDELKASILLHHDISNLELCGVQMLSNSSDDNLVQAQFLEQDFLCKKLDTLLHNLLCNRVFSLIN